MAGRTVRRVKRAKGKELVIKAIYRPRDLPAIVITPPDKADMKVKVSKGDARKKWLRPHNDVINEAHSSPDAEADRAMADFDVNRLIAELSENSRASRTEIENIQKKLLQQADQILRVNAFANTPAIDSAHKYSTNKPVYGRIPINANRNHNVDAPRVVSAVAHQAGVSRQALSDARTAAKVVRPDTQLDHGDTQLVPERLRDTPAAAPGPGVAASVTPRPLEAGRGGFFYETSCRRVSGAGAHGDSAHSAQSALSAHSARVAAAAAPLRGTVECVPPYRMPPTPEAASSAAPALPGASAPCLPAAGAAALHTHSAKFPIEREVILSSGDKNSKVPVLQEARKRGRLAQALGAGAVAPDTPPKALLAWSHSENQQHQRAGTSGEFRQYHEQNYGYAMHQHQNQGVLPRNAVYDAPKPPMHANNTIYAKDMPNDSQQITVTVETGKDNTRDAPKSAKAVSKTYHTLKDMISSRFKNKDNADDKSEPEPNLNNSEERKKPENEINQRDSGIRKVEQGIYGRPILQNRADIQNRCEAPERPDMQSKPDVQYSRATAAAYPSPSPSQHSNRQFLQHIAQQQMMMSQQARSQEMLASTPLRHHPHPQALGADSLYQQYGPPGRRSAVYQRDVDVASMTNFTSLKNGPQMQFDNSHLRQDLRSPQQLEREIVRQQGFVEGRRAASHPHLLDEPQRRPEVIMSQVCDRSRRNSHGNLLEGVVSNNGPLQYMRETEIERESDDGGFRARFVSHNRSSFEERIRSSGRSNESNRQETYRRTPDSHKESRRTPDSIGQRQREETSTSAPMTDRNDENTSQKSIDSVYRTNGKREVYIPQPSSSRQTPNRIEDLKAHGKKGTGSGASSDYDKNGGQSSNVDSGRGSVAYSSGRRRELSLHDTSADSDAVTPSGTQSQPQPSTSQQSAAQSLENEWVDQVECELRQILEPKLAGMRLDSSGSSVTSVTPPLPPLSPSSDIHKRSSLPCPGVGVGAGRAEYPEERRREGGRGRESPTPRWHSHKKHSSKRDHHYKKHLFGLDTTDMTSTTTRSLDLSSLLDARSDSDATSGAGAGAGAGDAAAIRRQLRGLENMYAEVLQLLGVKKPTLHPYSLAKQHSWDARVSSKRRYGSMSSLPSSSVSSRPQRDRDRDKRRSTTDHRKKHDLKGINKRFQRLESHVVTLARSVAHLSSEMRTQHLVMQEMDAIRAEISALRHMYKSQQYLRSGHHHHSDPFAFSNPDRVKRLTKFFGDEPPLMRLFLKKLGYEKYAALLEKEKVGAAELPYVGEDKLRALGVPLGPRMRILKEAGIHQELHVPREDPHNTTTTLAIV